MEILGEKRQQQQKIMQKRARKQAKANVSLAELEATKDITKHTQYYMHTCIQYTIKI